LADILTYEFDDGIATLTMNDGKANAMAPAMSSAINEGLNRAEQEATAVVIRGREDLFCGGFDLKIIRGDDEEAKLRMRQAGMELLERLYLFPKPVVFAVTGHAVAMGALLLFTGDARIGMRGDFKIGLNETAIGLPLPIAGLELARDRLLPTALTDAAINAKLYTPEEAAAIGYLDRAADPYGFEHVVKETAQALSELDSTAFAATKRRVREPTIERIRALS